MAKNCIDPVKLSDAHGFEAKKLTSSDYRDDQGESVLVVFTIVSIKSSCLIVSVNKQKERSTSESSNHT
ncbi:unnamed protein product, partial [Ceratitis capitata]